MKLGWGTSLPLSNPCFKGAGAQDGETSCPFFRDQETDTSGRRELSQSVYCVPCFPLQGTEEKEAGDQSVQRSQAGDHHLLLHWARMSKAGS
jgi:hypothetical protein